MLTAQDQVEQRKNTIEMFGYDFMIDDAYNVWLIEINSSPAMDYSTVTPHTGFSEASVQFYFCLPFFK